MRSPCPVTQLPQHLDLRPVVVERKTPPRGRWQKPPFLSICGVRTPWRVPPPPKLDDGNVIAPSCRRQSWCASTEMMREDTERTTMKRKGQRVDRQEDRSDRLRNYEWHRLWIKRKVFVQSLENDRSRVIKIWKVTTNVWQSILVPEDRKGTGLNAFSKALEGRESSYIETKGRWAEPTWKRMNMIMLASFQVKGVGHTLVVIRFTKWERGFMG
ncbi:hypothetical protein Syun_008709 [Stephania yunnanensis]|uniref:Uncharacterized protein n=1 Tax=Stephania yunnanensis TaxID=152371 RepID=A0AAP0PQ90_9MAGN